MGGLECPGRVIERTVVSTTEPIYEEILHGKVSAEPRGDGRRLWGGDTKYFQKLSDHYIDFSRLNYFGAVGQLFWHDKAALMTLYLH